MGVIGNAGQLPPNVEAAYWASSDPVFRSWLADQSVGWDNPVPTNPAFLGYKADRGPNGEWLSPEQIHQKRQFEAIEREDELNIELEPFRLAENGLWRNPETGNIEERPLTADEQFDLDLENEANDYLRRAQAGELPVSLATEKTLGEQEGLLGEAMSRRGGRLWREGTPGINQQGNFMLTSEATKEAERHGETNVAAGLLNQRQASLSDLSSRRLGLLGGLGWPSNSLTNAYGNIQQPYLFQNMLNSRQNIQNSVNRAGATAGNYQLAGTALGAGAAIGGEALYNYYNQPSNTNTGLYGYANNH